MNKILLSLLLLIVISINLGCSFFDEEEETFQLIVRNTGRLPAVVIVNDRYAGRALPHEKSLMGQYPKSKFTHIIAQSEEGSVYKNEYLNTNKVEDLVWYVHAN